mmetsp:Transcript_8942/g.16095  ORF Transcript_8942/g.16095 Transcript_8942/m.16095 type:complete len:285 (-) Transcript_8942:278-1132(-)
MSLCMPCRSLVSTDVGRLMSSGEESCRLAKQIIDVSNETQKQGTRLIEFAEGVQQTLIKMRTDLNPDVLPEIEELLDEEKMKRSLGVVRAMGALSHKCIVSTNDLSRSIQESIDCLPSQTAGQQGPLEESEETEEEENIDFRAEIADLEECTETIRNLNVFNASKNGTKAFDGLITKSLFLHSIMDRIKKLCVKVAQISQALIVDGCCTKIRAGTPSSLKELKRALHLSKIISDLAESAGRLVEVMSTFILASKATFLRFNGQFKAAKELDGDHCSLISPFDCV